LAFKEKVPAVRPLQAWSKRRTAKKDMIKDRIKAFQVGVFAIIIMLMVWI